MGKKRKAVAEEEVGLDVSPFEVVCVGGTAVNVREAPQSAASSVGKKKKGAILYGVEQDGWLKLTREPGFVLIALPDGRELLKKKTKEVAPTQEALEILAMAQQMAAGSAADPIPKGFGKGGAWGTLGLDPDVVELCDNFNIPDTQAKKLNELLGCRPDSFADDLNRLWTNMEAADNPMGLLLSRMRAFEDGLLVKQFDSDPEMDRLAKKYELDTDAYNRLAVSIGRHPPDKKEQYYMDLEKHLEAAKKPSVTAMTLLKTIRAGEPLGEVTHKYAGWKVHQEKVKAREEEQKKQEEERKKRDEEAAANRFDERYEDRRVSQRWEGDDNEGSRRRDDRGDGHRGRRDDYDSGGGYGDRGGDRRGERGGDRGGDRGDDRGGDRGAGDRGERFDLRGAGGTTSGGGSRTDRGGGRGDDRYDRERSRGDYPERDDRGGTDGYREPRGRDRDDHRPDDRRGNYERDGGDREPRDSRRGGGRQYDNEPPLLH